MAACVAPGPQTGLLGLAEGAAHTPGLGPLDVDLARELAGDARWRAWIGDASGAITATGTSTCQPTAAIARLVRAQAANCDLDHAIPWHNVPTRTQNLGAAMPAASLKAHYGSNLATHDRITWTHTRPPLREERALCCVS